MSLHLRGLLVARHRWQSLACKAAHQAGAQGVSGCCQAVPEVPGHLQACALCQSFA